MDFFKKALQAIENADFVETFNLLDKAHITEANSPMYAQYKQQFMFNPQNYQFKDQLKVFINEEIRKAQSPLLEDFEKLAKASQFKLQKERPFTFEGKILKISFNDEKDYEYQLHDKIAISIRGNADIKGQVFEMFADKDDDFSFF